MKSKKITSFATSSVLLASVFCLAAIGAVNDNRATIKSIKNQVQIKFGESLWRNASVDQLVRPNTHIRTGSMAKAELLYPDGSITRIGSRSELSVLEKEERSVKIAKGRMWFKVNKESKKGLKIYAPGAVAAITGTEGLANIVDDNAEEISSNFPLLFASADFTSAPVKIAQDPNGVGLQIALATGTAEISPTDNKGNITGDTIQIVPGIAISIVDGVINRIEIDPSTLRSNFSDISTSDDLASNNNNDNFNTKSDKDNGNNNNNNNNSTPDNTNLTGNNTNSNSNNQGGSNIINANLGQSNPTENVPNKPNQQQQQNIENSPTTGDLEIIIK